MRLGACRAAAERMPAAVRGRLGLRHRMDLEAHVARCAGCAELLRDTRATVTTLQRAYGSLRGTRAPIAPARVRAAIRWTAAPAARTRSALVGRFAEVALAAAMAVFVVGDLPAARAESIDDGHRDEIRARATPNMDDSTRFIGVPRMGGERLIDDLVDPSLAVPALVPDELDARGSRGLQ